MNKALLIGRITKDVELKHTSNGIPNVVFTLAVNRPYKDAQGITPADFINCVAWRQTAEFMARYVRKGYLLAVEGQIQVRNYTNQQGQTIYVTEIMCDSVENLTPKDPTPQYPQNQQGYTQPQQPKNNYYDENNGLPF